ncbi:hypothetical protein AAG906_016584 [Vitis piasezkii]
MLNRPLPTSLKSLEQPLNSPFEKNSFKWTESKRAFQDLKHASDNATVPLAYMSQAIHGKALQLSTYEKELMALVLAMEEMESQVLWNKRWVLLFKEKWITKLLGYEFVVEYKQGKENKVVDALSEKWKIEGRKLYAITAPANTWLEQLRTSYAIDPKLQQIIKNLEQGSLASQNYKQRDGLLFYKGRLYIPASKELREQILYLLHSSPQGGHSGFHKTLHRAKSEFYWEGMRKEVRRITELESYSVIMVVVDLLSKHAHFIPISHPYIASKIARVFLANIFKLHGLPNSIVTDRDPTFTSTFWKELLSCFSGDKPKGWVKWLPLAEWWYNTNIHASTKLSPFESVYGYPLPKLIPYTPGTTQLQEVENTLKTRDEIIRILRTNLQLAQDRMKKFADIKRTERSFNIGDLVYLRLQPYKQQSVVQRRNLKLSPRFYGPYRVLEKIGTVAYRLELPPEAKIHPVFHVSCLKKKLGERHQLVVTLPPADKDGVIRPNRRNIAQRLKKKKSCGDQVLVKWKGSEDEASWVEYSTLVNEFRTLWTRSFNEGAMSCALGAQLCNAYYLICWLLII